MFLHSSFWPLTTTSFWKMDGRLYEAVQRGDVPAFQDFIKNDKDIIKKSTFRNLNSVLHIAAKFGHLDLASEIIKLLPEMASAENEKKETPLHEACREGHLDVMELLLETDPGVPYKRNCYNESVLLVACARGQLNVVKHLLNNSRLLMLEDDGSTTSLHVAVLEGHLDIVKELLKARPDLARKQDLHRCSPLHLACRKDHLEIVGEFIRLDPELSSLQDKDGRTPLHWAAINGRINILIKILSTSQESAKKVTALGETVLHLALKNNQYDVIKHLFGTLHFNRTFHLRSFVNAPDKDGNTILHIATARKITNMVKYLVRIRGISVNALNRQRLTALDVIETSGSSTDSLQLRSILKRAGGRRFNQLNINSNLLSEISDNNSTETGCIYNVKQSSSDYVVENERISKNLRESEREKTREERRRELHMESLQNARNTNVILAVLIATVTYDAGINPPCDKPKNGGSTCFKVFMVCNNVALFSSLAIVILLVSFITFRLKPLKKLVALTQKIMWVSVSFMTTSYITATWMAMPPDDKGTGWVLAALLSTGGGCLMSTFVGLGVMLARHLLGKRKARKERKETERLEMEGKCKMEMGITEDYDPIQDPLDIRYWPSLNVGTNDSDYDFARTKGLYPIV